MGSDANVVQLGNGDAHFMKVDENRDKLESVDVVQHSLPSMIPVSPDLRNEGLNFAPEFVSPKTVLTLPPESSCVDSHQKFYGTGSPDAGNPCTPKEGFFDPFAPGLDDLMLAPRSSKYLPEPRSSAARSLNFGAPMKVAIDGNCESDVEAILEDEKLLEILYDDLLEVILSTQVTSIQHGTSLHEILVKHTVLDRFKTPERLLRGAADSCPPAPLKFGRKFVSINRGEKLLEILYDDLLEVILSTQVASIQHGTSLHEILVKHTVLDRFKTPERLLRGAADSCPPAPLKFGRKFVSINRGLCRKLEF